jgi:hypothetical protein
LNLRIDKKLQNFSTKALMGREESEEMRKQRRRGAGGKNY